MDTLSFPIFPRNTIKKQTLFSINDIQVIFNTDVKTAEKLEDDEVLKDYIRAVIQANLLATHGIVDTTQITSIERLDVCDGERVIVALDIATNVQQGVEELRCCVTEERILSDLEEPIHSEDSSLSWNQQQVPEVTTGPTLRWNSEMTTLLIRIRGDMDREFNRAKYKFRLWEKVAAKMNSMLLNVKVTAKDCDDKWRNIVATYRKNIDKIKCYGDNSVRWEYFNAMDSILKGTKDLSDPLNENNGEQMAKLISELNHSDLIKVENDVEVVDISAEHSSEEEMVSADDDDYSQNVIITRKSTDERRKWTTDMTLMLLHLRYQADNKFKENFQNTFHLWKELASQMSERLMSDFSTTEVESVWNHCVITYEINLENLKSKGVNTIKWKYFAVMDELLGGTSEIADICIPRPGEHLLKKFRKLQMRNDLLRATTLPESDPLSYTSTPPITVDDDSDNEDTGFTLSGTIWTKDMVKTLIFLKKQINDEIANNKLSRKRQWLAIVRRFRSLKNIKITEEACEEKWRYLLRTYKKNLLRVKTRGTAVKWPFFWKMREIVGNTVLLDSEKKTLSCLDGNARRLNDPSVVRPRQSLTTDYMDEVDDILEDRIQDQMETLYSAVNEMRQNQIKSLQDLLETQNKAIVEIQQEQVNIKCLLTQLLQKFT